MRADHRFQPLTYYQDRYLSYELQHFDQNSDRLLFTGHWEVHTNLQ